MVSVEVKNGLNTREEVIIMDLGLLKLKDAPKPVKMIKENQLVLLYIRTGRCWCEAESSKTCKRYKNGYKRFDFTGNEEHKNSKNSANYYKRLLIKHMKETINICCMILGNNDEYLDTNRCKAEHASLDIGKFTNLVKKSLKEVQPEKMKNGKNANQFLKDKFRKALHSVIFYARVVRGKSGGVTNDCKCLKFSAGGIKCTPC